ncbi:MAG: hypothetical protein IKX28_04330, partial [Bacteroidales bacterium]|nr:hypothetical protein [Bacteroidales bacterium]
MPRVARTSAAMAARFSTSSGGNDHRRADTQGDDQRGEVREALDLLQQEAHEDEDEAVAGVTHTEGEE